MPTLRIPDTDIARILRWCVGRVPAEARHQVRIEYEVDRGHVTIVERRAPWREDGGPQWSRTPIARLRYTKASGMWSLYWPDRNGRFHTYSGAAPTERVDDLLTEIDQ